MRNTFAFCLATTLALSLTISLRAQGSQKDPPPGEEKSQDVRSVLERRMKQIEEETKRQMEQLEQQKKKIEAQAKMQLEQLDMEAKKMAEQARMRMEEMTRKMKEAAGQLANPERRRPSP